MVDSSDQRDFRRMTIDCAMVYRHEGSDADQPATARNISSSGVLFRCKEPLSQGDRLVINVTPEKPVVPPLNAVVEVLRVSPAEEGDQYEVACVIQEFGD